MLRMWQKQTSHEACRDVSAVMSGIVKFGSSARICLHLPRRLGYTSMITSKRTQSRICCMYPIWRGLARLGFSGSDGVVGRALGLPPAPPSGAAFQGFSLRCGVVRSMPLLGGGGVGVMIMIILILIIIIIITIIIIIILLLFSS